VAVVVAVVVTVVVAGVGVRVVLAASGVIKNYVNAF
jgi:hypothetical protein